MDQAEIKKDGLYVDDPFISAYRAALQEAGFVFTVTAHKRYPLISRIEFEYTEDRYEELKRILVGVSTSIQQNKKS